jgi:hypothetical protein
MRTGPRRPRVLPEKSAEVIHMAMASVCADMSCIDRRGRGPAISEAVRVVWYAIELGMCITVGVTTATGCSGQTGDARSAMASGQLCADTTCLREEGDVVEDLVSRINADPDELHWDYTPAVTKLIEIGEPALSRCLDLALNDDIATRQHGITAVRGITKKMMKSSGTEGSWGAFWVEMGDLSESQVFEDRVVAVERLRWWMATQW